ncbi:hypothetical protein [Thermococcus sp. P6]|uniref:hypothetical protein n=1 Tax=Thermococcus sp. P6 TaxID=122420 RepID=UPI0012FD6C54|nr:hypothetical protein [Thermococcus sp. P6]
MDIRTSSTTLEGVNMRASNTTPAVYYVGSPEVAAIVQKAGFNKVSTLNGFKALSGEEGIIIINRSLNENEVDLGEALKRGFVIVTIGEDALYQMRRTLLKMNCPSVDFYYSDSRGKLVRTKVYAYKLMKKLPNGKCRIYIKGYAGNLTPGMLRTAAFEALSTGGNWVTNSYISWSSYDAWKPFGRLNIEHRLMYYTDDPWSDMDLWAVRATTQIISGRELGWSYFKNDYLENTYSLKKYTDIYELRDYDPTSISNVGASVGVSLGWGSVSPDLSWSYSGNYICEITDHSDFGVDVARWNHDFCSWGSYGTVKTIKIEPGFEFTVSPETTGKQEWKITAGWVMDEGSWHLTVERTLVIVFTLAYYS